MKTDSLYKILSSEFRFSFPKISLLPEPTLAEIAFVGRSNVGKSSLINLLCQKKKLVRTSSTPGQTRALNYFEITFCDQEDAKEDRLDYSCYFVDLPGYGYAKRSKSELKDWQSLFEGYLLKRKTLVLLLLLIDARRELGEEEKMLAELGRRGNLLVVFTKADQLSQSQKAKALSNVAKELKIKKEKIFLASNVERSKFPVDNLRNFVLSSTLSR